MQKIELTESTYARRYDQLVRSGMKSLGSAADAEDCASAALLRLAERQAEGYVYHDQDELLTLIHTGLVRDELRRRTRGYGPTEVPAGLDLELRSGQEYATPLTRLADADTVMEAGAVIAALRKCKNPRAVQAFVLHHLRGLTWQEVGDALGVTRQRAYQLADIASTFTRKELT